MDTLDNKADKFSTEIPGPRKASKECSVCKSYSTRTILYVCESGHVVCAHCQPDDLDAKAIRNGHGDGSAQTNHKRKDGVHILKRHKSDIIHETTKDLASGDCDKQVKTESLKEKAKSGHKIKSIYSDKNIQHELVKSDKNAHVETIVEYKNVNFKESKSSDSDLSTPSLLEIAEELQESKESLMSEACPRPVICPVLNCGKTIAMNSAMQHFHYDHPKVPRVVITKGNSQNALLKAAEISTKTQCLNIFLLQEKECCEKIERRVSSLEVLKENFTPLLLMTAKMLTKQFTSEHNKKHYVKQKICNDNSDTFYFKENEMLLLWVCKLEEPQIRYSITLISNDKKHGQSYIGESVHIREDQNALAIFRRAESLVLHGVAANRLLEHGQLFVILNVL